MRGRDQRLSALLCSMVVILGAGLAIQMIPSRGVEVDDSRDPVPAGAPKFDDSAAREPALLAGPRKEEVERRFFEATAMLHAKRYEYALVAVERVLEIAPEMPEAHVNRGFALIGLGVPERAVRSFEQAIDLRPSQVNAYYGLAVASDELGDRPTALGAMRTYVHLAEPDDPFVRKARAALWEWQSEGDRPGLPDAALAGTPRQREGDARKEGVGDEG